MPFSNPQDRYCCFRCGLSDRVEKAEVSQRVELPHSPVPGTPLVYESPWGCFSVCFVLFVFVAFLFLLVAYIANASSPIGNPQDILPYLLISTLLSIIAVFIVIHHVQKAKSDKIEVARGSAEQSNRYKILQEIYEHEKDIYDQLYYCGRDNVVFLLEKPETCVPASEVERLYQMQIT